MTFAYPSDSRGAILPSDDWLLLMLLAMFIAWPIALKLASRPKKKQSDWDDDP